MAFIDKKDPVVLNIKLTSKGRELLSRGLLNFKYFAIGDSEMDYGFNASVEAVDPDHTPFYSHILRPADKNPNILSFIKQNSNSTGYTAISSIPVTPTLVTNTVPSLGFFNNLDFITDTDHVKQPDAMIRIDEVTGDTIVSGVSRNFLRLYKSPTYLANVNEPVGGDYLLVKWTNPYGVSTTGYTVASGSPTPYLVYKIVDVEGKLSTNDLIVEVDRKPPDFSLMTGGTTGMTAGAIVLYNYINFTGDTVYNQYSTDFVNESVLTFLENCQCPTVTFPFWNLSVIFTEEIAGVQSGDTVFGSFDSRIHGGFVSYIQNQAPVYKKLGVIHYSNSSPSNTYAEEFAMNDPARWPRLFIPTVMWHKNSERRMGVVLTPTGSVKSLTGLTTPYYDLADEDGNVVGKLFNNLKIFVIEDQELLFAISYKSNRSWTLPDYTVGVNDNVVIGCAQCTIIFYSGLTNPSTINGSDGVINIYGIDGNIPGSMIVLSVSGATGVVYFNPVTDLTDNVMITGLTAGDYSILVYDTGSINCTPQKATLVDPTSILKMYGVTGSSNVLNPDFKITQYLGNQYKPQITNIGDPYGLTPYYKYVYGTVYTGSTGWQTSNIITLPPIPKNKYTLVVRDSGSSGQVFYAARSYITYPLPILSTTITTSKLTNTQGTFIIVGNYIPATTWGPLAGYAVVEISIYKQGSVPVVWHSTNPTATKYILVTQGAGTYKVSARVRKDEVIMEEVAYTNTVIIN
jgi:hypothetical protein